ncbi:3-hydroxybutyrate dehydrogenase [Nannochloropsis gaditana]|uniref:3-oxoacyl-[acyl-carrier-protein] reductase n=2 Tax=Nannochloropsis gaditana TaxID=72520 RepID=W7TRW9_9STRA|nr:3-hydroxybutyrate dehydrogenase [Nannochloropsis gaditana]
MELSLQGSRRAFITGAGSGIGAGIASSLALEHGWEVIATDVNLEAAQGTAAQIKAKDGKAEAYALNVADNTQIVSLIEQLKREGKNVDVLINNAGLQHVARLEDFPAEKWGFMIQVMLTGVADLTRAILPMMHEQGFGRIVNIGSIHSVIASPFKSAYVAAKHGLIGFSKVIALETSDVDITINTICPSYVKTPLVDAQIANQAKTHGISEDEVINKIMLEPMPKKAFISIQELVGTTLFLTSDAARNMTGQTLVLDGGWTVR